MTEDISDDVKQEATLEVVLEMDQENLTKALKILSDSGVDLLIKKVSPVAQASYVPFSLTYNPCCHCCRAPNNLYPPQSTWTPWAVPHPSPTVVPYNPWAGGTTGTPPPSFCDSTSSTCKFDPKCQISYTTSVCVPPCNRYLEKEKGKSLEEDEQDFVYDANENLRFELEDLRYLGLEDDVVRDVRERLVDLKNLIDSDLTADERMDLIMRRASYRKDVLSELEDQLKEEKVDWADWSAEKHRSKKKKKH